MFRYFFSRVPLPIKHGLVTPEETFHVKNVGLHPLPRRDANIRGPDGAGSTQTVDLIKAYRSDF